MVVNRNIDYPPLEDAQKSALHAALGPKVALANPLDYHTYIWTDPAAMPATYTAAMQADLALGVVVSDFPRNDRCTDQDWEPVINAVTATARATGKPMAIVSALAENISEATATRLIADGITPLCGMQDALDAIETAAWLGQNRNPQGEILLPGDSGPAQTLTEAEAKQILADHGLQIPRSLRANGLTELADIAPRMTFPAVLKLEGLAHKSDAGGVALNLADPQQVLDAARAMPGEKFLLEQMITGSIAELLIGVVKDPAHGFVLSIGAGGVLTEILGDVANLLLPTNPDAIRNALQTLRIWPLLNGYRGAPQADLDAIIAAVLAVQACVIANADRIEEVEINPAICTARGAIAADALIRMAKPDD